MFFRAIGRMTIRFLAGFGRTITGLLRNVVLHPVGTIFTVLIVGALAYGFFAMDGFGLMKGGANGSSVITAEASQAATGKSEEFLNALGKLDANGMWNQLGNSLKQAQIGKGITNADAMQKAINTKVNELGKGNSKPKYKFMWIRGQANSDGSAMDIFRGDIEWVAAGNTMPKLIAYIITTDTDGKVSNIETQSQNASDTETEDPIVVAAFPTNAKDAKAKEAGYGAVDAKRKAATEDFMAGVTNFDAKRIWNTLSPTYQKELNDLKVTPESMQKVFDDIKKQAQDGKIKLSYAGYTLRQSASYPNGNALDEYWASLQIRDQVQTPSYNLLLDSNYKITAIGTDDPFLAPGLGRKQQTTGQ